MEITGEHVKIAERIALRVARTPVGRLAGADELVSQSLVTLWEMALSYDESRNVPFSAYLHIGMQRRLIDWLRLEFGRPPGNHGGTGKRLAMHMNTTSLHWYDDTDEDDPKQIPCPRNSVEDSVLARLELSAFAQSLDTLTALERDSLIWPAWADTSTEVAERHNTSVSVVAVTRHKIKKKMAARAA